MQKKITDEKAQSARRLRGIREETKLTQERFAELMDISVSAYKKLESGENRLSIASLKRLHEVLGVSADYLLFGEEQGVEAAWVKLMNCSEPDKLFLLVRLLLHFMQNQGSLYVLRDEEKLSCQEIMQFIRELEQ